MADEGQPRPHRPESTIVQSFSADLDSMFGLGGGADVGQLEQTVEEKKQGLSDADRQLQELEAKLRETEQRLAQVSRGNSPARQTNAGAARSAPPVPQQHESGHGQASTSPLAQRPAFPADRPPTGREDAAQNFGPHMAGGMPGTPRAASNDYVMSTRDRQGSR
ncbi:hypothetical protein Tdes44962_MAKER03223 [Teratosphaeria destructans]|uniref:Uncharacterized protein n=1 Tax=Teratosphaeria destructans TaxID=418781 RepID=A0A9W7SQY7_9PEZI|nr:hypothetical protein Tdes44962_MAKER03223 [Teratosphaeria destructans]